MLLWALYKHSYYHVLVNNLKETICWLIKQKFWGYCLTFSPVWYCFLPQGWESCGCPIDGSSIFSMHILQVIIIQSVTWRIGQVWIVGKVCLCKRNNRWVSTRAKFVYTQSIHTGLFHYSYQNISDKHYIVSKTFGSTDSALTLSIPLTLCFALTLSFATLLC